MQNILPSIKGFKELTRSTILLLILALVGLTATAQTPAQVNITVNIIPPYSPYYSDYSGTNAGKVLLIVRNLTATQKRIKLTGELTGNNGIRISTKSTYVPLQPIILQPNETKQLNGTALKDIFDLNSLNVYGVDKVKLVQTSRLPEGDYTFCLQAVDMNTNQVITNTAPQGCTIITIAYPEAPILINPLNENTVEPTQPQSVVFNWINAGYVPIGTQYQFELMAIPSLVRTNPNQLLNGTSFPLIKKTINSLSYVLSPADVPLVPNTSYAWRVKAIDPTGKTQFKNGGISQASVFYYNTGLKPPLLISPNANATLAESVLPTLSFTWEKIKMRVPLNYNFQLVEVPANVNDPSTAFKTGKYLINKTQTTETYTFTKDDPILLPGKKYAWRVKVFNYDSNVKFMSDGFSAINTFTSSAVKTTEILAKAPVIISPTDNFAFKENADSSQPNVAVEWTPTKVDYPVRYQFKVAKVPKGISPEIAMGANLLPEIDQFLTATKIVIEGKRSIAYLKLADDATYAIQVIAKPVDTTKVYPMRIENNGISKVISFTYTKNKVAEVKNAPITSSIVGRLFYRFKEENEKPITNVLGFPAVTSYKQVDPNGGLGIGGMKMIDVEKYDNETYPDFVGNNRFPMGSNARPLKNVAINLIYTIVQSKNNSPTKFSDLSRTGWANVIDGNLQKITIKGQEYKYGGFVKSTVLKEDGSFSATFNNTYKLGYLGSDKGLSYFGVIRIYMDKHDYYTNSDLMIIPKVGKTTTLPDDIVFVKSYNAEVKVTTVKNIKNQAQTAGLGLPNYAVTLVDFHHYFTGYSDGSTHLNTGNDMIDDPLTVPIESNVNSYAGQFIVDLDELKVSKEIPKDAKNTLQVVDIVRTDANGVAKFTNLLATHSHLAGMLENPFDGTLNYKPQLSTRISATGEGLDDFSTDFNPTTVKISMEASPKKPEIYLRAVTIQNGLPKGIENVNVQIISYDKNNPNKIVGDENYKTDKNGYFQLGDLNEKVWRTITLSKYGFANKNVTTVKQEILLGERFPSTVEQEMLGAGKIAGYIVNEKGQPVECNIKVADGPFIKSTNGAFTVQNTPSGWLNIQIVPTVDNYFAESFASVISSDGNWTVITNPDGKANGRIVLKEKLHRLQLQIVDEDNKPIANATATVGNSLTKYTSNNAGLTNAITIASPDDEFKIKVSANGYVNYDDYVLLPINKNTKVIAVTLRFGQTISGTVLDAKTKQPIARARVYTISGFNDDGEVQNETYTDASGKYNLSGVVSEIEYVGARYISVRQPNGTMMKIPISSYASKSVKVYAVKSENVSYLRQEVASVAGSSVSKSTANFSLTPLGAKAELWGFPIEVNEVKMVQQTIKISGNLVAINNNSTFKTQGDNTVIPFKDVAVTFTKGKDPFGGLQGQTYGNDVPLGSYKPISDAVELETTTLKVKTFDNYMCEVIGSEKFRETKKISIVNDNGWGVLKGYVTSELASFNFSYNYDGKFQLNSQFRTPGKSATYLPVFFANKASEPAITYKLSPLYGKSDFSIHNFSAKLASGKFDKDAFYIDANVNMQIPLVGVNTLPAGQLKVTTSDIVWNQYTGDITLPLEKWTLKGKGLTYDINKGGFKVVEGSLVTDLPQVALKDLMIMPKSIDLGATKLTGKEALSLANVSPLNLTPNASFTLNFDDASPFDQQPHYRLNLSSTDDVVAYINDLPGAGVSKVNIKMLSAYSDAQHKTVILGNSKMNYHNVVSQDVTGIDIAENFFTLVGNTNIEIPGANANVTGRFKFVKDLNNPNRDKNGVVMFVDKMQTDVTMAGNVNFEGVTYSLKPNELKINGKVLMYKNTVSDAIQGISGTLTKTVNGYNKAINMVINDNQKIALGAKSLKITTGGNQVVNNAWNNLKFTGQPQNYTTLSPSGVKSMLKSGEDLIDFEVRGGIETDTASNKKIGISDINTSFGKLAITFDFDQKIFQGSLAFTNLEIPMGPVTVQSGTVDVQMDPNGFILVGAISKAKITAPLPDAIVSNFKSGIAVGYYNGSFPLYMKNNLLGVSLYKELPSEFNTSVKGFYVNVMRALDKNDLPKLPGPNLKSIPIIGSFVPTFDFSAGIDLYAFLSVDKGLSIGVGGKAFAQASCLYDLELCTIGLSGGAYGKFDLKYNGDLTGNIGFGVNGNISYCVGNLGVGIDLLVQKTATKFEFKPSLR